LKPGDVVIMDNVRMHKVPGVREAIDARGATVPSFPPYRPEFDPIKLAFSKLKAKLRASAGRSASRLRTIIRSPLKSFSPQECSAYVAHAGYRSTIRSRPRGDRNAWTTGASMAVMQSSKTM
jgi:transposase